MTLFDRIFKKPVFKKLYFLSLFLVGLPPFFAFFSFLNVNTLAKLIWLFLFFGLAFGFHKPKKPKTGKDLFLLFVVLFAVQSASVFPTQNVIEFLRQYEDLVFAVMFFAISFYVIEGKNDIKNTIFILLLSGLINLSSQAFLFLFPNTFLNIGELFLHTDYLELISLNINRKRIYFEAYDEALIPIIFYALLNAKEKTKTFYFLYAATISVFSFVSNFRTRFLMLLVAVAGSFIAFLRVLKRKVYIIGSFVLGVFFLYFIVVQSQGFTVVERLLLEEKGEDVVTITSRIDRWQKATEIGLSSPALGVGLGNYYDYLDPSMKHAYSIFEQKLKEFQFAAFYPHNIFFKALAETGITGFVILVLVFVYFVKKDWEIMRNSNSLSKAFVVSFWTIAVHSFFNPSFTIKYQTLFWLFRILAEKSEVLKTEISLG